MIFGILGNGFVCLEKFKTLCIRSYYLRRFAGAGRGVSIGHHFMTYNPDRITVEDDVVIAHHVTLRALTEYAWTSPTQHFDPRIVLKRGCFINCFSEVAATKRVVIGENVMLAQGCYIADNNHGYEDVSRSCKEQPAEVCGEVHIGDGSWLGAYTVVVGNITIGKHCVIGANSVVTRNLPDYSVAAGAPARILKRYDVAARRWRRTDPEGAFSD